MDPSFEELQDMLGFDLEEDLEEKEEDDAGDDEVVGVDAVELTISESLQKKLDAINREFVDPVARAEREQRWLRALEITLNEAKYLDEFYTNKHEDWKREKIQIANNKDKHPKDPNSGKKKTVQMTIDLYTARGFSEKKEYLGGIPYPADSPKHNWDGQGVQPAKRKITIRMMNGQADTFSPSYNTMQQYSTTAQTALENKIAGSAKNSEKFMGNDQKNALEGESIYLLLDLIVSVIPTFYDDWVVGYAFDGLRTDWFIRKKSWLIEDNWVAIQQKSAQIQFGLKTNYHLSPNEYDERIYCIAVGMLDYVHNTNPLNYDDTSSKAKIFEIFDVGKSNDLRPTPGFDYKTLDKSKRLYVSHARAGVDDPTAFITKMLKNIDEWPHKMTREKIMFDMVDLNKKSTVQKRTEMAGIKKMEDIVKKLGGYVLAPKRQNETVDSVIVFGEHKIAISNKTASFDHRDVKQRQFMLKTAPFNRFCKFVFAFYNDLGSKCAVIQSDKVYNTGLTYFGWNEARLKAGVVHLFNTESGDDIEAFGRLICPQLRKREREAHK